MIGATYKFGTVKSKPEYSPVQKRPVPNLTGYNYSAKDENVILYFFNKCNELSGLAAKQLDNAGFSQVFELDGGVEAWFAKEKFSYK